MPTFDTPEPISVTVDLSVGDARIVASDRDDTVVDVRPSNRSRKSDVDAAEQTRVDYSNGRLLVKTPKPSGLFSLFGMGSSVDVVIWLPAGSSVQANAAWTAFRCEGRLGRCRFKTAGDIWLDHTAELDVDSATGDVTVDQVVGQATVLTGSGEVRIREIDGAAVIKNASGDCWVGEISGDLRVSTASGDITVGRARADVGATTAYGTVRVGEVVRGVVELETASGELEVGIRDGTAAWLDVSTQYGAVRNALDASDGPDQVDETVKVRARTSYGDIVIRRSSPGTHK